MNVFITNKEIKYLQMVYFNTKTQEESNQLASPTNFVYKLIPLPEVTNSIIILKYICLS